MLLQTNSYIVPKDKRAEHARLMARFRKCFERLGSAFEVYEQVGPDFAPEPGGGGRFVQIMRFRDGPHQQDVHRREAADRTAQALIAEFCRLVNLPYQQRQGLFAASYYSGVLDDATPADPDADPEADQPPAPVVIAVPAAEANGEADHHHDHHDDELPGELADYEADSDQGDEFDELFEEDEAARHASPR